MTCLRITIKHITSQTCQIDVNPERIMGAPTVQTLGAVRWRAPKHDVDKITRCSPKKKWSKTTTCTLARHMRSHELCACRYRDKSRSWNLAKASCNCAHLLTLLALSLLFFIWTTQMAV